MRMTHFPFLVNPISPGARQIYTDPVQTHIPRNQWMDILWAIYIIRGIVNTMFCFL